MTRFTTFLALVVGGMEVIQPAAAARVLAAGLTARIHLGPVGVDLLQRRQATSPVASCGSVCTPIISTVASNNCTPSECCSASFENGYFNCFVCVAAIIDLTDYTEPQSNIDTLYDECANLGLQLPVLTFPGQNPNRTLSSVAPPSSQTTVVATITFAPPPSLIPTSFPSEISATSTQAPLPSSSSSSGIRSAEMSCSNLIASAMMLGLWGLSCSAVKTPRIP